MPRLMDVKKLMEYLSLGRNRARDVGAEANAIVRIGGRVLYDRNKIDAYIDRIGGGENDAGNRKDA